MQGIIHNIGHPVTPAFVTSLGIPDYMFGIFFATMALGLVVGSPIWGHLGDKGHKERYMLIGLLIYSVGQYGFGYAGNMYWMVFFRLLSGFGVSASITLMVTHIIEFSEEDERAKILAWHAALFVVGSSIGYYVGGFINESSFFVNLLGTDSFSRIFMVQAIWNLGHAFIMFYLVGLDQFESDTTKARSNILDGFKNIKHMDRNLLVFFISLTFISLGAINISKFIEVYMNDLGYSSLDIGQFVFVTGIVSLFANAVITPLVARFRKDFVSMMAIQLLSIIVIFIVFRIDQFMIALYSLFLIYVALKAIYTPLEQSYVSSHAKKGNYGTVMGVRQSFFSVGMVVGPLIGGFLYDIMPRYVFDFSVIMFSIGFVLLLIINQKIKKDYALSQQKLSIE
jgi:DHA1 family multidrug resistance protein-like MFS transporter